MHKNANTVKIKYKENFSKNGRFLTKNDRSLVKRYRFLKKHHDATGRAFRETECDSVKIFNV